MFGCLLPTVHWSAVPQFEAVRSKAASFSLFTFTVLKAKTFCTDIGKLSRANIYEIMCTTCILHMQPSDFCQYSRKAISIHLVFSFHGLFCCSWRWCCGVVELNGSQTAWNISWPVFFQLSLACQIIYTSPLYPTLTHNTKYTQHILPSACSCLYPCYHNCTTFTKPIQLKKKNLSRHSMFEHCQPMRNHDTEQLQERNKK